MERLDRFGGGGDWDFATGWLRPAAIIIARANLFTNDLTEPFSERRAAELIEATRLFHLTAFIRHSSDFTPRRSRPTICSAR
jgi:hypothetical protein